MAMAFASVAELVKSIFPAFSSNRLAMAFLQEYIISEEMRPAAC
jgi:hypothetical protein